MSTLALIPARGGSKGIPGKNLRIVAGRPLLAWGIEAARGAGRVDRVVVTTDDPDVAAEATRRGAEVVTRPPELATDHASSEDALLHALDTLRRREGYTPELTVFLQCTAPLTLPRDVDGTVERLLATSADAAFAAAPFHGFLWRPAGAGGPEGESVVAVDHDGSRRLRRQDRSPRYLEAGAVYAFRTAGFLAARHRFFGRTVAHLLPQERCLEVDSPADLDRAAFILARRAGEALEDHLPEPLEALVLDFDGVLTDDRVLVTTEGSEAVLCHRGDGHGLARLRETGVELLILSAETDGVVAVRGRKLGIEVIQGRLDKHAVLDRWLRDRGVPWERTVFVGNDLPDVPCLEAAGCGVAVADADPRAMRAARVVLTRPGGRGAVRELTDAILGRRARRKGDR